MYALSTAFAFLSGAAGLIYEICWVRLLGYSVGSDSTAISIVLSAFFFGMALGSYLLSRLSQKNKLSINHYAILEICIGISGLILLSLLTRLDLFIAAFPDFATTLFGKFIVSQLLLFIPTLCLGATFPLLASLVIRSQKNMGLQLSQLYSYNIMGAIVGTMTAGFLLIPNFGLDGAIYFAAAINISIAIIALVYRHRFSIIDISNKTDNRPLTSPIEQSTNTRHLSIATMSLVLSGFALIACEIAWTKYFAIVTGSSLYSFSIILAVTLSGISTGSWLIRHYVNRAKKLASGLTILLLALSIALLALKYFFSFLPILMNEINFLENTSNIRQLYRYGLVFLLLFPVTLLFGFIFPIALRLFTDNVDQIKSRVGMAFAINTFASIVSAITVGLWIIPTFGTDILFKIVIIITAMSAIIFTTLLPKCTSNTPTPIKEVITSKFISIKNSFSTTLSFSIIIIALFGSAIDFKAVTEATNYQYKQALDNNQQPKYFYLAEGKNSVVSLLTYDNNVALLQNNGLQESMIALNDKAPPLTFETLQAYIPYFFQKKSESAFVIGYGGGSTTLALLDTAVKKVDIVEIEPEIVNAVKQIKNGPADSLTDSRVNLMFGDARTVLLASNKKYDIITSQPSHPWLSGSANILTREFFSLASSHLNENGIMTQWIALFRMDTTALKSILKAFYLEFPYGFTLEHKETGDMMLVGAKSQLSFDYSNIYNKIQKKEISQTLQKLNITEPEDIFWFFNLSRAEIVNSTKNTVPNTDLNIINEVRLAARHENGKGAEDPLQYLNALASMDVVSLLDNETAKITLFKTGKKFLEWGAPLKAKKIIAQLKSIDQLWSDNLQHEMLFWQTDYLAANQLFSLHQNWLDITYYRQFQMSLSSQNQQPNINQYLGKVKSPPLKQLMQAELYYRNKNWPALSQMTPIDVKTERFRLTGIIKLGNTRAADNLAAITPVTFENIEFIKVMEKAYITSNESSKANWMNTQLNNLFNLRLNFYQVMITNARMENNTPWENTLRQKISGLQSQFYYQESM